MAVSRSKSTPTGTKNGTAVKLESVNGRLRLRWTFRGRRYVLALGLEDTKTNRLSSQQTILAIEADIESGKFTGALDRYKRAASRGSKNFTVVELFEEWLGFKRSHCDERTIDWYRDTQKNLQTFFQQKSASLIDRQAATAFLEWLGKQSLSAETQQRRMESISSCWGWAVKEGLIAHNPWEGLSKLIVVGEPEEAKPFTSEEIDKILKAFDEHPRYNQLAPFVRFMLWTGARPGEAIGLRWCDLSEDCKEVTIRTQVTKRKHASDVRRKPPKKNKVRKFKVASPVQELLLALRSISNHESVFLWNERTINLDNFREDVWRVLLGQAEVDYRPPKNCRHTFVSHCLEMKMNPVDIAKITGHRTRVLFDHYAGKLKDAETPEF